MTVEEARWATAIAETYASGTIGRPSAARAHDGDAAPAVPGYRVTRMLSRGGMGLVYEAEELAFSRLVAIKVLRPALASEEMRARLMQEARLIGGLAHPGILTVHRLARTSSGDPCLIMLEVRGSPWSERLRAKPKRALEEELAVLVRLCDAVSYVHANGVVHRDLKPDNVMVDELGQVILIDFGVAVRPGVDPVGLAGTPGYMAPEMARADAAEIGPRTDVYLLGAILYELLSGRPPHERDRGEDVLAIIARAARGELTLPAGPAELVAVCTRALAPSPADRFADVASFRAALEGYLRTFERYREAEALDREHARALTVLAPRLRMRDRAAAADLTGALAGLERAHALAPDSTALREHLVQAHRMTAQAALAGGDVYRATISARAIAELDPRSAREAVELRMRAFREMLATFPRLRTAVRTATVYGVIAAVAAGNWVLYLAQVALGTLPLGATFWRDAALILPPAVSSILLLIATLGVRRGRRSAWKRAIRLARITTLLALPLTLFGLVQLVLGILTAAQKRDFLPLLEAAIGCALIVFPSVAYLGFSHSDVERLPWLERD